VGLFSFFLEYVSRGLGLPVLQEGKKTNGYGAASAGSGYPGRE